MSLQMSSMYIQYSLEKHAPALTCWLLYCTDNNSKTVRQKCREWKPDMELQYVKNHSLKALSTFYAPSLLSLMCGGLSWLGCGSIQTHEPESARPVQPCGAPGETGCGLTCSILPSSSSQRLASLPDIPTHRLECQPVSSTGSWVWQCWLQGSDGPLMGPSAQQPHEGRQRGWGRQVCLCSTCYPPLPPQRPGQMPVTLILEKAETETKGN